MSRKVHSHHNFLVLFVLLLTLLSAGFNPANATIRVLDRNPGSVAHFRTAQGANDSAAIGDTIICVGENNGGYGSATISKQLYFVGPGYFLTNLIPAPVNTNSAHFGTITFATGSDNSVIEGFETANILVNQGVANVTIKKCYGNNVYLSGTATIIQQSKVSSVTIMTDATATIKNNIITSNLTCSDGTSVTMNLVYNNYIGGSIDIYRSDFFNNIAVGSTFTLHSNSAAEYNFFSGNGGNARADLFNHFNVTVSAMIIGTGSGDQMYQTAAGSPTISGGMDGITAGPFGGPAAYVLSGRSYYPQITMFQTIGHGTTQTGLPVTVSARAY